LTLLLEISNCVNDGSQFIIASHSPILLGIPNAEIISFDYGQIHSCAYEETESYQVTKMFIENKEAMLNKLLREIDYESNGANTSEAKDKKISKHDEEPYYGDCSDVLPYEKEAQELVDELIRLFDGKKTNVLTVLSLVSGYESDTKALLNYIKSNSDVSAQEVIDYALDLYDERGYEDD